MAEIQIRKQFITTKQYCMRWVKASNDDLTDMGRKHWRCGKTKEPLTPGVAFNLFFKVKNHPIEWLDESESTPSGESMEDVLDRNHNLNLGLLSITTEQIKAAMSEWASIQCKGRDVEIEGKNRVISKMYADWVNDTRELHSNLSTKEAAVADLEIRNGYLWDVIKIKEAAIKELVESIEESYTILCSVSDDLEMGTLGRIFVDNEIKRLKTFITKHKPTTTT